MKPAVTQTPNANAGILTIPDLKRLLVETGWITEELEYVSCCNGERVFSDVAVETNSNANNPPHLSLFF